MKKFNELPFFLQIQLFLRFQTRLIRQDIGYIKLFQQPSFNVQVAMAIADVNPDCSIYPDNQHLSSIHLSHTAEIIKKIIEIENLTSICNG